MDEEKYRRFLSYLIGETDRYLSDRKVNDQEMIAFINELENFKAKVADSILPAKVKNAANRLKFDYSVTKIERGYVNFMLAYITFGSWALLARSRKKKLRSHSLGMIRSELNKLLLHTNL